MIRNVQVVYTNVDKSVEIKMTSDICYSGLGDAKPSACSKCCYSLLFHQIHLYIIHLFAKQYYYNANAFVLMKPLCTFIVTNSPGHIQACSHRSTSFHLFTSLTAINSHM